MAHVGYSTQRELTFIDNLGRHRRVGPQQLSRLDLLKNYRVGLESRTAWGQLNKRVVMNYVDFSIRKITARGRAR